MFLFGVTFYFCRVLRMVLGTSKHFYNIGVSYKKADVATRSKFSLSAEMQHSFLSDLKRQGFEGVCVISTCNRTEVFGFADHPYQLINVLCKYSGGAVEEFAKISTIQKNTEAIRHLFRIATGLESQILGDYEIISQLRQSFKDSKKLRLTNSYTERLYNSVLQASKRVKNETELSSGVTSVSYAAIQFILDTVPNYKEKKITLFGFGKMGLYTCKNLVNYTESKNVTLVNRTQEKVRDFVKENPALHWGDYTNLKKIIQETDILIVSTGAEYQTITTDLVDSNKEMLIIDLSLPANVAKEVGDFEKVTLINVDELSKVTKETLKTREEEVPAAEKIIEEHIEEFQEWLHHRQYSSAIHALKISLENIKKDELAYQKKKLENFDENQAEIVTSRLIQKITTQFVKHLKEDDEIASQSLALMKKVFQA